MSCIAIWIMFLATVISYFIFISGEEYGNFESFYWSVVSITFVNGFSSNFGFAVNFNATMYGAGMPASSFVTFIVHKSYNYFYNIYFWDDYDYKFVVVQYAFTSFFLALTGALWTWDQIISMGFVSGPPTIEIDASVTPTSADPGKEALYGSGPSQIKVEKKVGSASGNPVPDNYVRYKHTLQSGAANTFTLFSVKHNDQVLNGIVTQPTGTTDVTAVYVYYHKDNDREHQFPLIVCVKMTGSTQTYYTRGQTWSDAGSTLNAVDPESTQTTDIDKIKGKLDELKVVYEINIKETSTYKASAAGAQIQVTPETNESKVPAGYIRYKHTIQSGNDTPFKLGFVKYNDIPLNGITKENNVQVVFVYYEKNNDREHQFPLIVCVKTSPTARKYYKRGNTWTEVNPKIEKGPEEDQVAEKLRPKLNPLVQEYEVKIDKISDYKARPDNNGNITPTELTGTGYKGYKHQIPETTNKINRITIHGQIVDIPELQSGKTINEKPFVFVYFEKEDAERDRQKPLLICLSKDGTSSNKTTADNNKWYKRTYTASTRQNNWTDVTSQGYNTIKPAESDNTISTKLVQKLTTISGELQNAKDEGYTPLDCVLKLDYVAKDTRMFPHPHVNICW